MTHLEYLEVISAGAELEYVPELIKVKNAIEIGELVDAKNTLELMASDGETSWHHKCWDLAEAIA